MQLECHAVNGVSATYRQYNKVSYVAMTMVCAKVAQQGSVEQQVRRIKRA
jgi:hypothetical protein